MASSDQDFTHRQNNNDNPETALNMDEEAEVEYVSYNRFNDGINIDTSDTNRFQRSAELFFGTSLMVFGLALELAGVAPYQRPIPAQQLQNGVFFYNLANNEIYNGQTVPDALLIVLAVVVPLAIQLCMPRKTDPLDRHKTLCVYFTAVGITIILTNFVKLYAGYLRPIFLQGCAPDDNYENCTGKDRQMRLSFPSGHASLSFCGLCVFSFYLEHRFGMSASRILLLNKENGELMMACKQNSRYMRMLSILCYSPVMLAIFIAASRVHDNMHFPADVVGGSLLGGSVALLVHQTWYDLPCCCEGFRSFHF